jgi:hypothetical protein
MAKPRYLLTVDGHEFAVARDCRSQNALWVLIEQRTGIERIAAQNMLDTGKMLVANGLIAMREDYGK